MDNETKDNEDEEQEDKDDDQEVRATGTQADFVLSVLSAFTVCLFVFSSVSLLCLLCRVCVCPFDLILFSY